MEWRWRPTRGRARQEERRIGLDLSLQHSVQAVAIKLMYEGRNKRVIERLEGVARAHGVRGREISTGIRGHVRIAPYQPRGSTVSAALRQCLRCCSQLKSA